tara:strand:+ start:9112 stop:9765 length:654 start_codon:yes stop_codon:yes gene_type:complete
MEIDLLAKYPKTKRNVDDRAEQRTPEDITIAKQFGKEYFDGDRKYGYGGYSYQPRFWGEVVKDFIKHYKLGPGSKILDVGSGKGFMLWDFLKVEPNLKVKGVDISQYGIDNTLESVKPFVEVGNAKDLSIFGDDEFDLVISINTIHNLPLDDCKLALKEIQRVGKNAFITMDAWYTAEEEEMMHKWNLTAETYMHVDDWKKLFDEVNYKGDYFWFIP